MTPSSKRRRMLAGTASLLIAALPGALRAEQQSTLRIVVPYPTGGFTDVLARNLARELAASGRLQCVVENIGGGGSTIGTRAVLNAKPDGRTLLMVGPDFAINETLMSGLGYRAPTDFVAVAPLAFSPMLLVVHPSIRATTAAQFVELARTSPRRITVASGGVGSGSHLSLGMLGSMLDLDLVHVPYKGVAPASADLLAGNVAAMFLQLPLARPHVASGALRALGVTSATRSPMLPEVPTIAEATGTRFEMVSWFGLVAPRATPPAALDRLEASIRQAMAQRPIVDLLGNSGASPFSGTRHTFQAHIESEIDRLGAIVRAVNAKPE